MTSGESGEGMTHVVCSAIVDLSTLQCLFPGFLDVDSAKSRLAGKDQGFDLISRRMKFLQFLNDWIRYGNTSWSAILGLFEACKLVGKIDISPFEIEDFSLACTCREGDEDNTIEIW